MGTGNLVSVDFVDSQTGYIFKDRHLLKTTDGGINWISTPLNIPNDVIVERGMFLDNNIGIFNIKSKVVYWSGGLYVTTDGGSNWNYYSPTADGSLDLQSCTMISETNGFASGVDVDILDIPVTPVIYKTTNSGLNWFLADIGGGANNYADIMFINPTTGFQCRFSILKTTNSGSSWFLHSQTFSQKTKFAKNFGDTMYMSSATGNVAKSINLGANWIDYYTGVNKTLTDIFFIDNQNGFAIGDTGAIVKTTNGGINWTIQNSGTTKRLNEVWFINNDTGFIAGDSGLLLVTYNGGVTSLSQNNQLIPGQFILYQNFPNPFNPSTSMRFDIPRHSDVKLTVYNLLGKEVKILVNESLDPGSYEYKFDAGGLPSGIYYFQLKSTNILQTKKMVVVK